MAQTIKSIPNKYFYTPNEFTSGNGTKSDAMIQPIIITSAMVSDLVISNCKYFFITKILPVNNMLSRCSCYDRR